MQKAYDRVDWRFPEGLLRKLGFGNTWVMWVGRIKALKMNKFCHVISHSSRMIL